MDNNQIDIAIILIAGMTMVLFVVVVDDVAPCAVRRRCHGDGAVLFLFVFGFPLFPSCDSLPPFASSCVTKRSFLVSFSCCTYHSDYYYLFCIRRET